MTASDPASHEERVSELAMGFAGYLRQHTDLEIVDPGAVSTDDGPGLLVAVERLDLALGQLADLASVYDTSAGPSLEPLALPVAALTGEYLAAAGARWLPPDPDDPTPSDGLTIVTAGGIAIDLLGVARATLLSGAPNLAAVVERLVDGAGAGEV